MKILSVTSYLRVLILVMLLFGIVSVNGTKSFAQTISVSSGISQPATVDGKTVKIYAGWANATGNCTAATGATSTTTCDTCREGADIPCNHASIHGSLYLQIDVTSTAASISGLPVQLSTTSDSITLISGATSSTASSSSYSLRIPWSSMCPGLGLSANCDEDGATVPNSLTKTVYFGPVKDSKFVETIALEITLSVFTSAVSNYTECASGATGSEAGAACYFKMFGGDEKIYVDTFEPGWNVDTPTIAVGSGTPAVRSVVFFANESPSVAADSTTFSAITNGSDFFEVAVQAGEDPLTDNRLNGFENGKRYCFKMATMDITGNILRYSPSYSADKCAEANEVIGILKDKNCFIATAAFGSPLNRHVQRFREFRNKFLATSEWGKEFIKFYYEYGPSAAAPIKKNENLRAIVRGALWPLLGFVEISLQYGLLWGIFSFLLTLLVFRKLFQTFRFRVLKRSV